MTRGLLIVLLSLSSNVLWSCDVCGSAMTGTGVNLLNAHYYSYAGLSWQHSYTRDEESDFDDLGHQLDLSVHYYLSDKFSLQFNLPYVVNQRRHTEESVIRKGIADVRLTARYALLNSIDLSEKLSTSLHVGAILSAPTGLYDPRIYNYDLPEHFNVGNGAWGYGAELLSVWNYKELGASLSGSTLLFSDNEVGYHYGQQVILRSGLFYTIPSKKNWSVIPQLAIQYEYQGSDTYQTGVINKDTGGESVMLFPGVSMQYDRYHLNVNAGLPLFTDFNSTEEVKHYRSSVQLFILFN